MVIHYIKTPVINHHDYLRSACHVVSQHGRIQRRGTRGNSPKRIIVDKQWPCLLVVNFRESDMKNNDNIYTSKIIHRLVTSYKLVLEGLIELV